MSSRVRNNNSKGTSISRRVTTWYSIFFLILSGTILSVIYSLSNYFITHSAQTQLETAVIDSVGDYVEGDFDVYDNGIYLSRYDISGHLIEGSVPIPVITKFAHATLNETTVNDIRYLYYDYYDNGTKLWFRGVLSTKQNDLITNNLLLIMFGSLPPILIIVLGGGYLIIHRAMKPIKNMSETAERIEQDIDLSQRIDIEQGNTELHQLAKTFNRMLDKVEKSYERERQFTSDVSHELRTPITVIKSETEYLYSLPELPPIAKEALTVIERQSRQMAKLVTDLLDITRLEHTQTIPKEEIDFSQLLAEQIENYTIISEAGRKQLQTRIQHNLIVYGDSQLLKRLVDNLLSNALKFSERSIDIQASYQNNHVELTITNDGQTIPKEYINKIWDRMYQGDQSRHSRGIGIGLSFVKKIAELHHITIEVSSQNHQTKFKLFFPSSS